MQIKGLSPLTGKDAVIERDAIANSIYVSGDPLIGEYGLMVEVLSEVSGGESARIRMLWAIASRRVHGETRPVFVLLHEDHYRRGPNSDRWLVLTLANILSECPSSASEHFDKALQNITASLRHPADLFQFGESEVPMLYCARFGEAKFILDDLVANGLLRDEGDSIRLNERVRGYRVTSRGWELVSEFNRRSGRVGRSAFVAMWFDRSLDDVFENGIKAVLEELSIRCVRIDGTEHNDKICDRIVKEIRDCSFLIADFTGNRGGVYFEAGLAFGLGKQVVWLVRSDYLESVHFDTRQYNHIVYTSANDLKERLKNRILATIDLVKD